MIVSGADITALIELAMSGTACAGARRPPPPRLLVVDDVAGVDPELEPALVEVFAEEEVLALVCVAPLVPAEVGEGTSSHVLVLSATNR